MLRVAALLASRTSAVVPVGTTIENGTAAGAKQSGPASRVAPFVGVLCERCGGRSAWVTLRVPRRHGHLALSWSCGRAPGSAPPELELDAHGADLDHAVGQVWRYRLVRSCAEVQDRTSRGLFGSELEVRGPLVNLEVSPPLRRSAVGATERVGEGGFVPGSGAAYDDEIVGEFRTLAERAVDLRADVGSSFDWVEYPCPFPKRRLMSDVLAVHTGQLCHPIPVSVGVEPDDGTDHLTVLSRLLQKGKIAHQVVWPPVPLPRSTRAV